MKSLVEYINEQINDQASEINETVWVVKDTDADTVLNVYETEEEAQAALAEQLKENADAHLEVSSCKKDEVEKNED